ncbi:MAG: alpha/beta hydrolase [Chthonomonadaceae bacterium]|nr:alpha/beta hydrolase [Chthonomonadaceae bacterium]
MNPITYVAVLILLLCAVSPSIALEKPLVLPIWPGAVPGDFGTFPPERVRDPSDAPTKTAKWITNVTTPTISVFRPSRKKNTGAAMVICPGGGYWNLAWDLEGEEVAGWLNSEGITSIVLKYRVPRREGQPERLPAPGPLLDAQRAVSLVRSNARNWGIDPNRIGMVGFSAGGHLTMMTATNFDRRSYEPIDKIDTVSCRPDFAVVIYSGYFLSDNKDSDILADYIRIPENTPPIFLAHSNDDTTARAKHSVLMYLALYKAHVPTELHVFAAGEHGFGVRKTTRPGATWPNLCISWLRERGVLKPAHVARQDMPEGRANSGL